MWWYAFAVEYLREVKSWLRAMRATFDLMRAIHRDQLLLNQSMFPIADDASLMRSKTFRDFGPEQTPGSNVIVPINDSWAAYNLRREAELRAREAELQGVPAGSAWQPGGDVEQFPPQISRPLTDMCEG